MDAWAHARTFNRKFILDEDKEIQDQVKAKGVTITKPDPAPFLQGDARASTRSSTPRRPARTPRRWSTTS